MPASPTRLADLPRAFPIFPLPGALLLPHGRLPLNIFEPRYLAMVEDALGAGRLFGMIQPDDARSAGEGGPALHRVGCLGRLAAFSETGDGRYLITLHGLIRYSVAEELPMRRGYRRVRAEYDGFEGDLEPGGSLAPGVRTALLDALRAYFDARAVQADWEAIGKMLDHVLVITLSMVCPFDAIEKQALLEAGPAERAGALLTLLRIGSHDAEQSTGSRAS